jgi:mono/diheme cytochrome c family protein
MKYTICTTVFIAIAILCFAQKKPAKYEYEFPKEMAANIKAEYIKICDKGQALYNLNCAGCHNIPNGKKSIIPDYTPEQLKGYELRVINPKHESDLPDTKVTPEELGNICTFLLYKKKNNTALK